MSPHLSVHFPRPVRRGAALRSRRHHVSRPHRRDGAGPRALCPSDASLYAHPAGRRAAVERTACHGSYRRARRSAERRRHPCRLRLRRSLAIGRAGLPKHGAPAHGHGAGASRCLSREHRRKRCDRADCLRGCSAPRVLDAIHAEIPVHHPVAWELLRCSNKQSRTGCTMEIGVFIPIGNNGWLISSTSPQYTPSFDLNREVVLRAERYGFDFALSMIKLRGFGGKSRYWDDNLESFTLMAGLASIPSRIELYATVAVLTMPPPLTARMGMTIDSISRGLFAVNLVTGWQKAEYDQMGLWPGDEHFKHRYELLDEYATVMQELWVKGQSDLKGRYYTMNDCRLGPLPSRPIPMICAGTSDAGMKFAAKHCAYNFCSGNGEMNNPRDCADSVARLNACTTEAGTGTKALALTLIIADETDEAAMAKWEHYKSGTDLDALAWSRAQAGADKHAAGHWT